MLMFCLCVTVRVINRTVIKMAGESVLVMNYK